MAFAGDDVDRAAWVVVPQRFGSGDTGDTVADDHYTFPASCGCSDGCGIFLHGVHVNVDGDRTTNAALAGETAFTFQAQAFERGQFVLAGRRQVVIAVQYHNGIGAA